MAYNFAYDYLLLQIVEILTRGYPVLVFVRPLSLFILVCIIQQNGYCPTRVANVYPRESLQVDPT